MRGMRPPGRPRLAKLLPSRLLLSPGHYDETWLASARPTAPQAITWSEHLGSWSYGTRTTILMGVLDIQSAGGPSPFIALAPSLVLTRRIDDLADIKAYKAQIDGFLPWHRVEFSHHVKGGQQPRFQGKQSADGRYSPVATPRIQPPRRSSLSRAPLTGFTALHPVHAHVVAHVDASRGC